MTIRSLLLGTFPDAQPLFRCMADRHHAIWLDSGLAPSSRGLFDILGCDPAVTLETRGEQTHIGGDTTIRTSTADPLQLLREEMQRRKPSRKRDMDSQWPLCGGALGYFSYELGSRFESLPAPVGEDTPLPEMAVGLYDWLVIYNRSSKEAHFVYDDMLVQDSELITQWTERLAAPHTGSRSSFRIIQEPLPAHGFDDYLTAFEKIMSYLREGDCYQVNLAQRFHAMCEGNPWELYCKLREINPAPFSAYLNTPSAQILCASPERFIQVQNGSVETRPIKGTRPRGSNPEEDERLAHELMHSAKDRAENVMIVDLLRNDLGRSCEPGTISVPQLFEIESFATVHHLVSTITGQLGAGDDALDLLRGSFPGGSITGAPKVRAMEIIHELEQKRRDIYCGSIGYIGYNGNMDTNIVIRTLLHREGKLTFWAGGGLVIDSTLESEYQETLDKAYSMQQVLQKSLWD